MTVQKLLGAIKRRTYRYVDNQSWINRQAAINFFKELYRATEYFYLYFRSQKLVVKYLGYGYQPSVDKIEIDITYRCNLACANCNRSVGVGQAKSNLDMTIEQIRTFVEESRAMGRQWKVIKLLGGEPTMHKKLDDIVSLLKEYIDQDSPNTRLELWTNGEGDKVRKVLGTLPDYVVVIDSSTTRGEEPLFNSFNLAPVDSMVYRFTDFSHGCSIIEKCGVGLTPYGYYPCAIAGGIDRVVGHDSGTQHLADADANMRKQLDEFCRLCGHFRASRSSRNQRKSPTWVSAYQDFKQHKPKLSTYGKAHTVSDIPVHIEPRLKRQRQVGQ